MTEKQTISDKNVNYHQSSTADENGSDKFENSITDPFIIGNEQTYELWREKKLSYKSLSVEKILIKIDSLDRITDVEKSAMLECCQKYNMVIYQAENTQCDPETLKIFARNFGLENLDLHYCNDNNGITALQFSNENNKGGFIPYSDKAINWHTDGYYNSADRQIYSLLLHCDTPAREGGENWLMDHEMVYIRLRDKNPAYIKALMNDDAMTIPAHIEKGVEIRGAQSGPVFSTYNDGQMLHMRYSQRKKNIIWRDDKVTRDAVSYLNYLLNDDKQDALHVKMEKGQGLICNNILHNRTAFTNETDQARLMYRGRFFEPVLQTN